MRTKAKKSVPEISITGLGLVTAVGHDCKTSCASIRAGLKRARKLTHFYVPDKKGYDAYEDGLVTGHAVLEKDDEERESRIIFLLSMALTDLKNNAGLDEARLFESRLFLALPDHDRGDFNEEAVQERLFDLEAWPFSHDNPVQFYPKGHAAMLFAMTDAIEALQRGEIERAVIAGTDSYIGFKDLSRLNIHERLRTEHNPDGLIPGEAAAAILMEKTDTAQNRDGSIKSMVKVISTTYNRPESPGSGLAQAIQGLIPYDDSPLLVDAVLCDLNGEPHRSTEWGMAQSKVFHRIKGPKHLICPAKSTGDTGAASAGVSMCIVARAMERGYLASHPNQTTSHALITSSSDTGERAALLLESFDNIRD